MERKRNGLNLFLDLQAIANRPPGWLLRWVDSFSESGCIAHAHRDRILWRILQSIPLDARDTYQAIFGQIFNADHVDLHVGRTLKVVGPLLRPGADPTASVIESVGNPAGAGGTRLELTVRSASALVGYEESWYSVVPREGSTIGLLLDRSQAIENGEPRSLEETGITSVDFLPASRFVRMVFLLRASPLGDHDVLFIVASTRSELEHRTEAVMGDPRSCLSEPASAWCRVGPRNLSFNLFVRVEFDGASHDVEPGASVGDLLNATGHGISPGSLGSLRILRPYGGRLARVEFDPSSDEILMLELLGGERIAVSDGPSRNRPREN